MQIISQKYLHIDGQGLDIYTDNEAIGRQRRRRPMPYGLLVESFARKIAGIFFIVLASFQANNKQGSDHASYSIL